MSAVPVALSMGTSNYPYFQACNPLRTTISDLVCDSIPTMAQTTLEVLSLDRARRELGIPLSVTDDNALLTGQIASSVEWVSRYLDAPLIQVIEARFGGKPERGDRPITVAGRYLAHVLRVRYWSDGASLRDSPDVTVDNADLGRITETAPDYHEIWPPADGWGDIDREGRILVDCVRELVPIPDGILAACVIVMRQLYDGIQDVRPSATFRALLAPYEKISYWADSFAAPLEEEYFDLTPSTPVTPTTVARYVGWSADRVIAGSDFATAGESTTDELTIPSGGPGVYLVRASARSISGYPTSLTIAGTSQNQLNAFDRQSGTVTFNSDDYIIGVSQHELAAGLSGRELHISGSVP